MSHICRKCAGEMPKDRKGWEQVCPKCLEEPMTKIREVLNKVWDNGYYNGELPEGITVDQAHSAILSAVRELLPKEKDNMCEFDPRLDIGEINKAERRGYNQAIADMKKKLDNETNNERSE